MVTKDIIVQFDDLQKEAKEVRKKIEALEKQIPQIEKRLKEIESGQLVKDKVSGGLGGIQSFTIEGIPVTEYESKKTELLTKKLLLSQRKSTLELLEFDLLQKTNDVEQFIAGISDSRIRRIINLKFIENKTWNEVALDIGGGNTEDSVRMSFNRFMGR